LKQTFSLGQGCGANCGLRNDSQKAIFAEIRREQMFQISIAGVLSILAVIGSYCGYDYYLSAASQPEISGEETAKEPAKTDYITIEIFKGGKVAGYLSFRALVSLKDPAAINMASYHIADIIHRKLPMVAPMTADAPADGSTDRLQSLLLPALKTRMGPGNISGLKIVDMAYDQRIQGDGAMR
jgi:hypothetical protein